jgi:nicotinamide phosphoribosyltransferase
MDRIQPLLLTDFYKVGHIFQYPPGTEFVYSNLTPRATRLPGVNEMVFFGLQYFCDRYLVQHFNEAFFERPRSEVIETYRRRIRTALGSDLRSYDHIADLHELGYLPIRIKAVPEGTPVPMRVPCLTIVNTDARFFWLTNFFETLMSCVMWQACTSATIAHEYRKLLDRHAKHTGMPPEFVQWQGHDFSFRGLSSPESAIASGMAHLLSFTGTDTIPAIDALERYYGANAETALIGGSVPATEHSVMCSGGQDDELGTFRRLITDTYPAGIVSIVADTWDLWTVCTEYLPALREDILARKGKVVIRPDSGDPVKIICGDPESPFASARKGVIELLWDVFGGTTTATGHRVLDSHIGVIYGDSITIARADAICSELAAKGFASQPVFGIGSYTYQNNTRDTFGTAIKATWVQISGQAQPIFKNPSTDDGTKKSATGLLRVDRADGRLVLRENVSRSEEAGGELRTVFHDGQLAGRQSLAEIRARLAAARAAQERERAGSARQ